MMKRLLFLVLVLAITAGANATIELSIDGEPAPDTYTMNVFDIIVIDVRSNDSSNYGAWLVLEDCAAGLGEWASDLRKLPAAGDPPWVIDPNPDFPCWWELEATSFDPDYPVLPGVHFEIDFRCLGEGDVVITLRSYDESELDRITIHQIPEPMTMALLGLGGPFLRRRK